MQSSIMLLYFVSIVVLAVHGQLSIDELFQFNSKHAAGGNCTDFQYSFADLRVEYHKYNQLIFNCRSSSLVLRNDQDASSSICPADEEYLRHFRIRFHRLRQTSIEVNQLRLSGIELSSLDDQIRSVYDEHSYYRSRWALLINLNPDNSDQQHLAIATNGEMTFVLFLLSSTYNKTLLGDQIELIFPGEQSFQFYQSGSHIWRIDQGYVRNPRELENTLHYQLSKSTFTLYDNETFDVYGTQFSSLRRFLVYIDETPALCTYNYILQCTFPVLPSRVQDTHEPLLKIFYSREEIFNATLKLRPRTRLHHIPTNHTLTAIETFEVNITGEICANQSLKSLFSFVVHLWKEDVNGTAQYTKLEKNGLPPVECNATAKIGHEIEKVISPISIDDVMSMHVDLIHQWDDDRACRAEKTRISFI